MGKPIALPFADTNLAGRVDVDLHYELEQFLYCEAKFLDERRFDEWLDLLSEDVRYFMPVRYNRAYKELDQEFAGPGACAHFDDSKAMLAMRIRRFKTGKAWAEDPPSRTRRIVGNVIAHRLVDRDDIQLDSNFHIYRGRHEHVVEQFAGARRDILTPCDGDSGWEISRRTIVLDQTVILAGNLGIFF